MTTDEQQDAIIEEQCDVLYYIESHFNGMQWQVVECDDNRGGAVTTFVINPQTGCMWEISVMEVENFMEEHR